MEVYVIKQNNECYMYYEDLDVLGDFQDFTTDIFKAEHFLTRTHAEKTMNGEKRLKNCKVIKIEIKEIE